MADELTSTEIITKANEPQRVNIDGNSVDQRSIDDIIKADRYAMTKKAQANRSLGVLFVNTRPPGGVI